MVISSPRWQMSFLYLHSYVYMWVYLFIEYNPPEYPFSLNCYVYHLINWMMNIAVQVDSVQMKNSYKKPHLRKPKHSYEEKQKFPNPIDSFDYPCLSFPPPSDEYDVPSINDLVCFWW